MTQENDKQWNTILHFWYDECSPADWFKKSDAFDTLLTERFGRLHQEVLEGVHSDWRRSPQGRVAEIILLDQFSRNMFRDTPQAFASDYLSLSLSQELISQGLDVNLESKYRKFAYMPFMHSENLEIQKRGIKLFKKLGIEDTLNYMIAHHDVIARFGRFPHRNAILGRENSWEELLYLEENGGF
ncbi:DUF924 family protein [Temperatibacter marinus]|uniref:DUF924 family protein n=1 Tax=Temperatibacter marinus TaxID=1456591 RepID=A0AA52EHI5_9PROT|nr:DUF924 family protein [Temperatibacter marinus]WND02171.1 DUF924 family protein [Temperatibacter marinus]